MKLPIANQVADWFATMILANTALKIRLDDNSAILSNSHWLYCTCRLCEHYLAYLCGVKKQFVVVNLLLLVVQILFQTAHWQELHNQFEGGSS